MAFGMEGEFATQGSKTLLHAAETNASADAAAKFLETCRGDTDALVGDFQQNAVLIAAEGNRGGKAIGMAMDVAQALLKNAEDTGFDFRGEPLERDGTIEEDVDAAAGAEFLQIVVEGDGQSSLIKQGRMK